MKKQIMIAGLIILFTTLVIKFFSNQNESTDTFLKIGNVFNKIAFKISPTRAITSPYKRTTFDGVELNIESDKDVNIYYSAFGDGFRIKKANNVKLYYCSIGHYADFKANRIRIDSSYIEKEVRYKPDYKIYYSDTLERNIVQDSLRVLIVD